MVIVSEFALNHGRSNLSSVQKYIIFATYGNTNLILMCQGLSIICTENNHLK